MRLPNRIALLSLSAAVSALALSWIGIPSAAAQSVAAPDYQVGVVEATNALPEAAQLGIGWSRVPLFWNGIQPTPGSWNVDYTNQDRALLQMAGEGIVPVGVVQTVPTWADVDPSEGANGVPKGLTLPWNSPDNYWGQFMYQLARHYAGLINTWIIGNEISIASGPYHTWDGTIKQMAEMIRVAYQAVHAANPAGQVQAPGAPYWYTYGRTTATLIDDLSQLPGAAKNHDFIDGINLHLYNTLQFNPTIYARYRQILKQAGLSALPIWLSEANAEPALAGHAGVTLTQQQNFLIEDLASSLGYVSKVEVYQMRDPSSLAGPEGPTGLLTHNLSPRPAFAALKTLVDALAGTQHLSQKLSAYHGYSPSTPATVNFGGVGRLVQVVWDQGFKPTRVDLKAWSPTAEVLSASGAERRVTAVNGAFALALAGSTDHSTTDVHDAPIGGAPIIVIQHVPLGAVGTPTKTPTNSPAEFAGNARPITATRGHESASLNVAQATLTITDNHTSVTVGGWGTHRGQLLGPSAVAIAPSGIVYVANSGAQNIVAYRPNGQWLTSWGSWGDGPGQFNGPDGIAVGASGTVYVADTLNQRVQAFSQSGQFEGQVASAWPGPLALSSSGTLTDTNTMTGLVQAVQFPATEKALPAAPNAMAVAVNPTDDAYAVATPQGQVDLYSATGSLIHTWAIPPAYGNRLPPVLSGLSWSGNTLYVSDSRYNRILAINTTLAAVPIRVSAGGLVDGNTVTVVPTSSALLLGPEALSATKAGTLWVANTDRQTVVEINPSSGGVLATVKVSGGSYGVAALPSGNLVLSAYYGDTVQELTGADTRVWRSGHPGGGETELSRPTTVVPLSDGDIAVWDSANHRAVVLSAQGQATNWIQAPAGATALSALPSGALIWATPAGLIPTLP